MTAATYFFDRALLGSRVAHNVRMSANRDGVIDSVESDAACAATDVRYAAALAGVPNVHSHAHQAAMAGRAERRGQHVDSFWTWRDVMYRFALAMTAEQFSAITTALFADMLEGGYTCVGEFHYLHHHPAGAHYDDVAELGRRAVAAAEDTGIAMTLLPVLYCHGDIGQVPAGDHQRRFVTGTDAFLDLLASSAAHTARCPHARIGVAPHSLRAVDTATLNTVLDASGLPDETPVHIHVAEQTAEVETARRVLGQTPVDHLLRTCQVNQHWCLIHATHTTPDELDGIAESGAVVGLCPTTEANLGDGIFNAVHYRGALAVGSDSNVCTDPAEEVRWLENTQRLQHRQRNVLGTPAAGTGCALLAAIQSGGAQALNQPTGALEPGRRADFVTLDPDMAGPLGDDVFDAYVFSAGRRAIQDVFVAGERKVIEGSHINRDALRTAARRALESLNV
ncbi:MAG: formimidoylglutamate deiminase [Pseudomonadota bacterium]